MAKRLSQGDEFVTLLKKLKAATNVGTEGVQKTILVLSGCRGNIVRELIQSNMALNDLTKVLAKSKVNNVDAEEMRKVLANRGLIKRSKGYTRAQVLSDLAKIADASGLHKLLSEKGIEGSASGLTSSDPGHIIGVLGELQTAAKYVEDGRKVKAVRHRLGTKRLGSEVDIVSL